MKGKSRFIISKERQFTVIRIIVADDEQKVCDLICQLIDWDGLGMQLLGTASNGIEALKLIKEKKPDLVITDIKMPHCGGMKLIELSHNENPDVEFIIISGYSQFEYAQTAIRYGVKDYILKPVNSDMLNSTLLNVRQRYIERQNRQKQQQEDEAQMRNAFWLDFESGVIPRTLEEVNRKYRYHLSEGIFRVFMVQADVKEFQDIDAPFVDRVLALCHMKCTALLEEYVRPLCYDLEAYNKEEFSAGLLNYSSEAANEVADIMTFLINRLSMELQVFNYMQLHLSLSREFKTLDGLKDAYSQAALAMGQRLFDRSAMILEHIPANSGYDLQLTKFSSAVQRSHDILDAEYIQSAVRELKQSAHDNGLSGSQIIQLVKDCYRIFLMSAVFQQKHKISNNEALESAFAKKAVLCGTVDSLFSFLADTCKVDLERERQFIDEEKIRPITQAKQYIHEHYAEQIGLDDVSTAVGFNSSYFSTIFHKETGQTFLEYLTLVRIEAAKVLLRENRITVEAVCKAVGSNDAKRFSKIFKKLAGAAQKNTATYILNKGLR